MIVRVGKPRARGATGPHIGPNRGSSGRNPEDPTRYVRSSAGDPPSAFDSYAHTKLRSIG